MCRLARLLRVLRFRRRLPRATYKTAPPVAHPERLRIADERAAGLRDFDWSQFHHGRSNDNAAAKPKRRPF